MVDKLDLALTSIILVMAASCICEDDSIPDYHKMRYLSRLDKYLFLKERIEVLRVVYPDMEISPVKASLHPEDLRALHVRYEDIMKQTKRLARESKL